MKHKNLFFSLLLILFGISAFGQDIKQLSMDEAVRLGVENSKYLKLDMAKKMEAEAQLLSAKNNKLPDFKVSASYLRLSNANVDIALRLPTSDSGHTASSPAINQALIGSANLSLPLFTGGRIKYGIQSAEYLLKAAELGSDADKNIIAYNIALAYTNLFKASKAINVLEENLTASLRRDSTFLKLENNGILARNDRLKAQLQTSNIELQILDAKNAFNIATVNMDLLLGLPESTQLQVDSTFADEPALNHTYNYFLDLALKSRKELEVTDYQLKAASLGIKAAKAESLPSLALTGGYMAARVPGFLTLTNAINLGLGLQYNLANIWKKNSSLHLAKAKELQLSTNKDILLDNIKLEVNRDYQNRVFAQRKIELYNQALEQATENYRINKNKFDNGLVNISDLLEADAALVNAKVNLVNAKADEALAYKKLLQTTGTLL